MGQNKISIVIDTAYNDAGIKKAKKDVSRFQKGAEQQVAFEKKQEVDKRMARAREAKAEKKAQAEKDLELAKKEKADKKTAAEEKKVMGERNRNQRNFQRNILIGGLGTMFFGMAIKRSVEGLLSPAMDAVGIFDIWSSILTVLFLPAALFLLGITLWFLKVFSELSPEMKIVINGIALLVLAFGTLLFVMGTLALGINSMIVAWGLLTGGGITAGMAGIGAGTAGAGAGAGVGAGVAAAGGLSIVALAAIVAAVIALLWIGKTFYDPETAQEESGQAFHEAGLAISKLLQQIPYVGEALGWSWEGLGDVIALGLESGGANLIKDLLFMTPAGMPLGGATIGAEATKDGKVDIGLALGLAVQRLAHGLTLGLSSAAFGVNPYESITRSASTEATTNQQTNNDGRTFIEQLIYNFTGAPQMPLAEGEANTIGQ